MKGIASTERVAVKVSHDELIDGRYLELGVLSKKLKQIEAETGQPYKGIRYKLYNCVSAKKYNICTQYGMRCIDVKNPMQTESASLVLEFKEE